jgi:branched-chain amino acid transport system substrate-binding protein
MLRQMSQLAMNQVKFLGGDAQCSERLPAMADKVPALKNVVCVMSGSSGQYARRSALEAEVRPAFPGQYQVYSPYAYDATMVLAKAMLSADSAQAEAYLPRLRQTRYEG